MKTKNKFPWTDDQLLEFAEKCADKMMPIYVIRGHTFIGAHGPGGLPVKEDIADLILEHIGELRESGSAWISSGGVKTEMVLDTEPRISISYDIDDLWSYAE